MVMGNLFVYLPMDSQLNASVRLMQRSLDGIISQQPRFSTAGLLDYIIELIVKEDEVSTWHIQLLHQSYRFMLGISVG